MRWDDPVFTGTHNNWSWVVVREMISTLRSLITEFHADQRLCITGFDSGPITPGPEEHSLGWTLIGDIMASPPLTEQMHIPSGEYDEWYIFPWLPSSIDITERYVYYCGFNLADPQAMADSQDSTWDRTNYDWLVPVQARFWSDMERLNPLSYVASGDADVVVTRNTGFAHRVVEAAREIEGNKAVNGSRR